MLVENGSYTEAKARFDTLGGYRDAESLSVYCRYAERCASGTTNDGSDSGSRDVYDDPEDLHEENRDWFDDADEAWDYWYED